jgi:ribosomal protein S25
VRTVSFSKDQQSKSKELEHEDQDHDTQLNSTSGETINSIKSDSSYVRRISQAYLATRRKSTGSIFPHKESRKNTIGLQTHSKNRKMEIFNEFKLLDPNSHCIYLKAQSISFFLPDDRKVEVWCHLVNAYEDPNGIRVDNFYGNGSLIKIRDSFSDPSVKVFSLRSDLCGITNLVFVIPNHLKAELEKENFKSINDFFNLKPRVESPCGKNFIEFDYNIKL